MVTLNVHTSSFSVIFTFMFHTFSKNISENLLVLYYCRIFAANYKRLGYGNKANTQCYSLVLSTEYATALHSDAFRLTSQRHRQGR